MKLKLGESIQDGGQTTVLVYDNDYKLPPYIKGLVLYDENNMPYKVVFAWSRNPNQFVLTLDKILLGKELYIKD